jgi:hypothetical protein
VWEEAANRAVGAGEGSLSQPNHAPFRGRPFGSQGVVTQVLAEYAVVAMRRVVVPSRVIVDVEADPLGIPCVRSIRQGRRGWRGGLDARQ